MNKHIPVLIMALLISLGSCQEVIEIDLNSADPVLVAEAYMELDLTCRLKLTYTTDYFHDESPQLEEAAEVILSDESGESETLRYLGEGIYRGQTIFGTELSDYTLTIVTDEQVYSGSSSLMPTPVFDTVRLEDFFFASSHPTEDFPKMLVLSFNVNPQRDNYFMLELTMNGERMEDYFALASDEYSADAQNVEYTTMFYPTEDGDTLSMKVYGIDEDTYRYYSQMNEAIGSSMGMSSTPYNPASNLGEDILGYFMARSRFDTTLVIQ